ncbi:MAG: hypothetical protein LBH45_00900 [Campylobacteraceae bacterium]|jgi:hypothetical protein|nr:hypothetical protein [Campylobacteraceae bacterium]
MRLFILALSIFILAGCAAGGFMPNAGVSDNVNGRTITSSNNILQSTDNKSIYFNPSVTIFNNNMNFSMFLSITSACDAKAFNKLKSVMFDIGAEKFIYDIGQSEYYACGGEFNYTKLTERGGIRINESDFVKLTNAEQLQIIIMGYNLTSKYQANSEFIANLKTFYRFAKDN